MKRKSLLFVLLLALLMPWAANAQTTGCEAIGEESTSYGAGGSGGAGYVPVDTYYKYSYEQMVYDGSEMPTTITSISFKYKSSYNMTEKDDVDIYLGETTSATLSSWMPASDLTLVYSGAMDFPASSNGAWVEFTFNQNEGSFSHDQSKYIVVVINDKSYAYPSSYYPSMYFCYQTCASGAHKYLRNDNNEYTVPPTSTASNASQCPIVRFCGTFPVVCCPKPKNLTCTTTTGAPVPSATFSWTNGGDETQWLLEYSLNENFTSATQVTINQTDLVNGEYTLNTGLTAEQTYYARIKAYCPSCEPNYSDWSNTIEFKPSNAFCNEIGTGTSTAYLVYTSYGSTYSQHIYTATELTAMGFSAGDIVSVSFNYSGASSTYDKTQSIYMGTTTKSSYSVGDASDFESDVTLVYGPTLLSYVAGWREYELTEPFEWDGASNIVVGMLTNSYASTSSGWSTYGTSTSPDYRTIYRYQDSNPIDITNLASVSNGSRSDYRPNINLCILPDPTPKPHNLAVSNITSTSATLTWSAPASGSPTGYEYQYKVATDQWPATWTSNGTNLTAPLSGLTAGTTYDFRVRATYADGESDPVETQFTTLDACAVPTGLAATLVYGNGSVATFSWTKGFSEDDDWVLQYGTDNTFATCTEITDGFTVSDNIVTFAATTSITPEVLHYARVKTDCGSGTYSSWSDVYEFTPTNCVDFTLNENATGYSSYAPFYNYYVGDGYTSQFIVPATSLTDIAGGTVKRLTFYSTSLYPNVSWGNAVFAVYVKEVQDENFATTPTSGQPLSFDGMINVYSGSLSVSGNQMVIELDNAFLYNGGNLMIGFEVTTLGTESSVSWVADPATNATAYSYYGYSSSTSSYTWTAKLDSKLPKVTFNYLPTPYKKPVIDEANCTYTATSAHIAWTVTGATPTGYQYQYKLASAAAWPTNWTSVNTAYADLSSLTSGTSYDFRVKALYDGGNESAVVDYSFFTECDVITAFPWSEKFESYAEGNFIHPCWVNEHISGSGEKIFKVYTTANGTNSTHQLQLPDQQNNTLTKLRLPEMNLPNNNYQFVIDVYRSSSFTDKTGEGVRVYASTNGEIEGATELAFIPRLYSVQSGTIPAETTGNAWYTYELPIGMSGTCYIILRGENKFGTSTYMDNFSVEAIPTCDRPKDLAWEDQTAHTATFSWTNGAEGQTAWQIAYSTDEDFDPDTVTPVDVNSNPGTISGLDAYTIYTAYVRANCGNGDYSPWCRVPVEFMTVNGDLPPTNLAVAEDPAVTQTTATITWNGVATNDYHASYELYYSTDPVLPQTPVQSSLITGIEGESYDFEGLTAATTYYVWVRDNCGTDGFSDWVGSVSFETLPNCVAPANLAVTENSETVEGATITWTGDNDSYVVEYREVITAPVEVNDTYDFEDGTQGWTTIDADGHGDAWSRYTSSGYNSSSSMKATYNSSYAHQDYLVSPQIPLGGSLSFYIKKGGSYTDTFRVYLSTSGNTNASDFTIELTNGNVEPTTTYTLYNYDLSSYSGMGYVAIVYTAAANMLSLYVDDIHVTASIAGEYGAWQPVSDANPTSPYTFDNLDDNTTYEVRVKGFCGNDASDYSNVVSFTTLDACPAPTQFTLGTVTSNSATISWNGGIATEWKVWIKENAETEYPTTYSTVTTATKSFDNLTGNTTYDVKIAPTCDETKYLEVEEAFTTDCDVVTTFPWKENFNSLTVDASIPSCWNNDDGTTTSANYKWCYNTSTSGNGATNGTSHDGSKCVRFNSYMNPDDNTNYLKTPALSLPNSPMQLSFWYKNPSGDDFSVYISTDGGDTYLTTSLFTGLTGQSTWEKKTYDLTAYAGQQNVVIVFGGTSNYGSGDAYIYLDDVEITYFFTKEIIGVGEDNWNTESNGGYYLIASPMITDITPSEDNGFITEGFDLYYFDEGVNDLEWRNYGTGIFDIVSGKGYLYASKEDTQLQFTGVPYSGDGKVTLQKSTGNNFEGWNLVGNPFNEIAYIADGRDFYTMQSGGSEILQSNSNSIEAMEGIFVIAEEDGETMTFTTTEPAKHDKGLALNLSRNNSLIDRAVVRFGEGRQLPKFQLNPNHTKVYIPMDGKDYAVVRSEEVGEMPVNFKAENNGSYTLSFSTENVEFGYLHLIDNMTGNDVDLLANPSYSFNARTTDYASRFKLVFATGSSTSSDTFAFYSNGNWVINNEGDATLQVIDINGRILKSESINGCANVNVNAAAGVYMIRLVNGDNVKVQKVVVR